jgi:DNA-binding MarR family transcriptional regulator
MPRLSDITTYQAGVYQSRAYRNLKRQKDRILKPHGLSMMQWSVLGLIYDAGAKGTRITDLAKQFGSTQAFITNTVNSLESKGFVGRSSAAHDSRTRDVIINSKHKKLIKKIEAEVREALRKEIYNNVTPKELEAYVNTLIKFSK